MAVKPIPEGYHTLTPCLMVAGAAKLIDFMKQAFGAEELERHLSPDGGIMHAQVQIGDSRLMLGEPRAPAAPMTAALYVYVRDADTTYKRALKAGATSLMEPMDQFYGDRHGGVKDAWGNTWWIATHIEDVSPEEMTRRAQAYANQLSTNPDKKN